MKIGYFVAVLALSVSCQRYSDNFGNFEWKNTLLKKPVDTIRVNESAFWVLHENGFTYVSKQGLSENSVIYDWKAYKVQEDGSSVQLLGKDNQIQEFLLASGKLEENIFVTQGEEILDFDINNIGTILLRSNGIETIDSKEKPHLVQFTGGKAISGKISNSDEAFVLYITSAPEKLCATKIALGNLKNTVDLAENGSCVDFSGVVKVIDANKDVFVVSINNLDVFAVSSQSHVQIGSQNSLNNIRFSLSDDHVGWISQEDEEDEATLKIAEFSDLSNSRSIKLEHHCVLNKVHNLKIEGIIVSCHNYSGKEWTDNRSGQISLTLKAFSSKNSNPVKVLTANLSGLNQFRYSQEIWFSPSSKGTDYDVEAVLGDDQGFRIFSKNSQINEFESGLTSIVDVHDENMKSTVGLDQDPMSNYFGQYNKMNIPFQGFVWRILQDVKNLQGFVTGKISKLLDLRSLNFLSIQQSIFKPGSTVDPEFLNEYGLRKQVIITTKGNVIYSLDSMTGKIQWKHYSAPNAQVLRVFRGTEPGSLEYQYTLSTAGKVQTWSQLISQADGKKLRHEPSLTYFEGESKVLRIVGNQKDGRIEVDYKNNQLFSSGSRRIFTFKVEQDGVRGYTLHNKDIEEMWNIKFSEQEKSIAHSYHLKGYSNYFESIDHGFYVQVPEAGTLIYKIVDTHNVAVLTQEEGNNGDGSVLNLYILNARRGKIMGKYSNSEVDFSKSINLLYDDNGIFVTYFNKKTATTEIWVFEVLKNEIESDFMQMISKFVTKSVEIKPIDYSNLDSDFILLERKYGLPFGVKSLKAVQTKNGLTKRNLIVITHNNDIYQIDRMMVSARRMEFIDGKPPKHRIGNEVYMSETLPGYHYRIPFAEQNVLNAHVKLSYIDKLEIFETAFESTCLVLGHGSDMFFTRVNPDGIFDMLSSDFNHVLLGIVVVLVTVVVVVLKNTASKKEAKQKFFSN